MRRFSIAALAIGIMFAYLPNAFADDSITWSDPTVTPVGSNFLWQYTVSIDQFEHINTAQNVAGTVLYDVQNIVPGTLVYNNAVGTLTDTLTQPLVGPVLFAQNPTDDPTIPNIAISYSGTAPSSTTLGTVQFQDTVGFSSAEENFSGVATLNATNAISGNTSSVPVPAPEPSTALLMLPGLVAVGALVRRRLLG